jgi:hypothetical protein
MQLVGWPDATVRHIIVCADEDGACLAHEERHRVEGAFHR